MFNVTDEVYFVNDIGVFLNKRYKIKSITKGLIILDASFVGKSKIRNFEHRIPIHLANKLLYHDFEIASEISKIRSYNKEHKIHPYSVGDLISWNNNRYSGEISEINNESLIVKLPMRVWSLCIYSLDIIKLN